MKLFVTGISTGVGKTVTAAIITEALQADYWKPVQAGDLQQSDSHTLKRLLSNSKTVIHENAYALQTAASPHASARMENTQLSIEKIKEPKSRNHLVIEGAGGLLVPLNDTDTIADLIKPDYLVVLVSRHYLGSINHTLLTVEALKTRNLNIAGIVFSGNENPDSESVILSKTGLPVLGRIADEPYFDNNVVLEYAEIFRPNLLALSS